MNIETIIQLVEGTLLTDPEMRYNEINGAGAADLMSDVLAYLQPGAILVTGLCNPQVVRTAQIAESSAILIVRGKTPPDETIDLANCEQIPLITTKLGMYDACGKLHRAGLSSLVKIVQDE